MVFVSAILALFVFSLNVSADPLPLQSKREFFSFQAQVPEAKNAIGIYSRDAATMLKVAVTLNGIFVGQEKVVDVKKGIIQ